MLSGYTDGFPEGVDAEGVMFDGSALMAEPGFWAAHFLNQSVEDEDLVTRVWNVPLDTVRAVQALLSRESAWPVFEIGITGGAKLLVVYRNFADDAGVDYLLVPGPDQECVRIAALEGEYQGPGISWRELSAVAALGVTPVEQARRMLLLAPMLGDTEAAAPAGVASLVEALRLTGGVDDLEEMAELIASDNLQWDPARWHTDSDGLVVCDEPASPRNPEGEVPLSTEDLRVVSDLLAV